MKTYLLVTIEHLIGFIYLIAFLMGFFNSDELPMFTGGIGMFLFITIMILDNQSFQKSFLFALFIGSIISAFISNWYYGIFWVSTFFVLGQIPGLIILISKRKQILLESKNNQVIFESYVAKDEITKREITWFIILIFVPIVSSLLLTN